MSQERPIAVQEALNIAPLDPMGQNGNVTIYARNVIKSWEDNDQKFRNDFNNLISSWKETEKDSFKLYLWSEAITLVRYLESPVAETPLEVKQENESLKGRLLFEYLLDPATKNEIEAVDKTYHHLNPQAFDAKNISTKSAETSSNTSPESEQDMYKLALSLQENLSEFDELLGKEKRSPEIREYIEILNNAKNFCRKNNIQDPHLWDFIIGNIKLTKNMEPEYQKVYGNMGFTESLKWNRIEQRRDAYAIMLNRADVNYTGYEALARGWKGLRDYHERYLKRFNLTGYIHQDKIDGTFVTYGATDAFLHAYLLSRLTLRHELKDEKFNPRILFPTPGFTMLAKLAKGLNIETVEMETVIEDNFFLNPEKLKKFLNNPENNDVLIIDLQFINNPSSTLAPPEQLKKVMEIISAHRGRNGSKIIVINDGAYLGMVHPDKLKQLEQNGAILNKYKRRIDVLPMTKIFGRPALRGGFAGTPDENLAKNIPAIIKILTPSVSYAMMQEALSIWDYVKYEDQQRFFEMLHSRQIKLLQALSKRQDIFDIENSFISPEQSEELAAFYLFVPLKEGINPLFIPIMTGLFGNLDDTFYLDRKAGKTGVKKYLRLAVGMEALPDYKLKKLESDLLMWKNIYDKLHSP